MGPHISIKGEKVFDLAGFPMTNSVLTALFVLALFVVLARKYYAESQKKDKGLFFYAMNGALKYIYTLFSSVLHSKTNTFFALLLSFFFFILLNNWSGLIPGVGSLLVKNPEYHAQEATEHTESTEAIPAEHHVREHIPLFRGGTADLNTTVALAMISVFITQFFGFKYLGAKAHLGKYFNFSNPVMLFVGILELILEFARILSFSFRLFGNIFAGEVLLTVVPFLLPVFLSFASAPMYFMEIFVGLVQALVFTMLSAVFINMAVAEHH